jgi:outer membrane protein TolC
MPNFRSRIMIMLSCTLLLSPLFQTPPLEAVEITPRSLSLAEAINIALENNVDLRVERENIRLQRSAILFERGQFDPTLHLDARVDKTVRESTSIIETGFVRTDQIDQENQRLSLGFNQRFGWGGDYDITFSQTRSSATLQEINPTFRGEPVLTFTQPLLRGFGREVTQGPLRIAQTRLQISQSVFRSQLMAIILEIGDVYWDLVFQRENLNVQQQSLRAAEQLLELNRNKVELGLLAPIEILVAEAGVASRVEGVVVAEKAIQDTEDRLRRLLNLPEQSISAPPPLLPTDAPIDTRKEWDETTLLATALRERPEMEQRQMELRNRALSIRIAENQLYPSLDLVGSVGLNGIGGSYSTELDQIESGDFYHWEAGVILSFPLGNRSARANVQREKSQWNQAALDRERTIQQITLETKEGLRRVETDYRRIESNRRARILAERQLMAGNERAALGLISSHDLLEFQTELADARGREIRAITDYNKSLINLDRVTGLLLERFNIKTAPAEGEGR